MASFIYPKFISIMANFHRIHSELKCIFLVALTMLVYIFFLVANIAIFILFFWKNSVDVLSLLIPIFQLNTPSIYLDSVNITNLNTEALNLTATFDSTFIFHTPNNDERPVSYSDLEVRVCCLEKTILPLQIQCC